MSPTRKWILPLVLVLVVVGFIALTLRPGSSEKTETYSGLVQRVTDDPGSVQEVVFSPNRQGIEATQELAKSPNAKVVVIGNSKNGLPLILGDVK
jgi:hypothetical protein